MVIKGFSTDLLPIINVNLYCTSLERKINNLIKEEDVNIINYINNSITDTIVNTGARYIQEQLDRVYDYVGRLRIRNVSWHTPTSYNYDYDQLYFDLEVDDDLLIYIDKFLDNDIHLNNSNQYLKDKYKSYKGHVNLMPDSVQTMKEKIHINTVRCVSAFIMYWFEDNVIVDFKEYQELFENDVIDKLNKNLNGTFKTINDAYTDIIHNYITLGYTVLAYGEELNGALTSISLMNNSDFIHINVTKRAMNHIEFIDYNFYTINIYHSNNKPMKNGNLWLSDLELIRTYSFIDLNKGNNNIEKCRISSMN